MRSCWGQTTTSGECLIHHLQFDEDRELLAFESTDGIKVEVYKGDITNENADAIVCSTNYNYSLQAGVSKAILATAGKELLKKCVDKFKAEGPLKVMIFYIFPECFFLILLPWCDNTLAYIGPCYRYFVNAICRALRKTAQVTKTVFNKTTTKCNCIPSSIFNKYMIAIKSLILSVLLKAIYSRPLCTD